ncbi:hypothetical protein HXV84_26930 [Pseudomonas amygdali pv. morsprunorum]|nr:hypothetical protein [Pseudomonas amygdali pv. morsprunorum]
MPNSATRYIWQDIASGRIQILTDGASLIYFGANSDDVGMGTTSADSLFGGAGNDTLSGASRAQATYLSKNQCLTAGQSKEHGTR